MFSCFGGQGTTRGTTSTTKAQKQKHDDSDLGWTHAIIQAKPRNPSPIASPADLSGQPDAAPVHSQQASKLASQPSLSSREGPSLLAQPTLLTGVAGTPPSAPTNASPAPLDPPPSVDYGLESKLLKATPWSTAVLTSDAKEVLLHYKGHESSAALLLDQALQLYNPIRPCSAPFAPAGGAPMSSPAPPSFLHTLLGPYLAAQALATLETGRPWRTNVTKHMACRDLLSSPGLLKATQKHSPSGKLGGAPSEDNSRAPLGSWSVGAGHIGPAHAGQADSADTGHDGIGHAGQSDPVGAVQAGKEHRLPDGPNATAGPKDLRWLNLGRTGTSGADADVKAFVSGLAPSEKAAHAGATVIQFASAAEEEAAPEHPCPMSDPNQFPRDPIPNGMADGQHAGMDDFSLDRMRTSISARDNCFQGSHHDQKPQHKSSADVTLSRSSSASNDSQQQDLLLHSGPCGL